MTVPQLTALVEEAVMLHRSTEDLKKRLDEIKERLIHAADELKAGGTKTDGGGVSVMLDGKDCVARVVFPGKKLIASVKKTDVLWAKISEAAGDEFRQLFKPTTTAKLMPDFRDLARQLLKAAEAKKLIDLCEEESTPTVSFEVTEKFGEDWP